MNLQSHNDFPSLGFSVTAGKTRRQTRGGVRRTVYKQGEQAATITVHVDNALTGELLASVHLKEDGAVMDLKQAVEEALGPKRQVSLAFQDAELEDTGKLVDYGILDNTHVPAT
eukprot:TRINITY_DN36988_c0_g1_i1.p1 TRINITY_DN36988_c0_g1~~TRINITY_DN36988_c0_g1_i1.p1  ORF type:complete len:114 (+),score=20.92 TRINITY_DN36988_c0_g1_i1:141-482(+)